jgi:hypothetical protein
MRMWGYTAAIAMLAMYTVPCIAPAYADSAFPHEYRIKAAFMYNFITFVDGWKFQEEAGQDNRNSSNDERSILIGIISEDPFQDAFEPLMDKRIRGRKIAIKYFKGLSDLDSEDKKTTVHPDIEDIKRCDVLFVGPSEQRYIDNTLDPIRTDSILTVADSEGFLQKGGIINFVTEKNKIRFEINTAAAKRAKLTIRSKLLRLATRVIAKDDVEGE